MLLAHVVDVVVVNASFSRSSLEGKHMNNISTAGASQIPNVDAPTLVSHRINQELTQQEARGIIWLAGSTSPYRVIHTSLIMFAVLNPV